LSYSASRQVSTSATQTCFTYVPTRTPSPFSKQEGRCTETKSTHVAITSLQSYMDMLATPRWAMCAFKRHLWLGVHSLSGKFPLYYYADNCLYLFCVLMQGNQERIIYSKPGNSRQQVFWCVHQTARTNAMMAHGYSDATQVARSPDYTIEGLYCCVGIQLFG
jgi:hypothetical protein